MIIPITKEYLKPGDNIVFVKNHTTHYCLITTGHKMVVESIGYCNRCVLIDEENNLIFENIPMSVINKHVGSIDESKQIRKINDLKYNINNFIESICPHREFHYRDDYYTCNITMNRDNEGGCNVCEKCLKHIPKEMINNHPKLTQELRLLKIHKIKNNIKLI